MTVMNGQDPALPETLHGAELLAAQGRQAYRCIAPACYALGCSDCNCAVPADVYAALLGPAQADLQQLQQLRATARRVVAAFELLGQSKNLVQRLHAHHQCEHAMVALQAAVRGGDGTEQPTGRKTS